MQHRTLWILLMLVLAGLAIALTLPLILPESDRTPALANDRFFELIGAGRTYDAYQSSAAMLQRVSFEGFERSLERSGFGAGAELVWEEPEVQSTEATFEGILNRADGGREEVTVKLVRETGQWRPYSIVSKSTGTVFRDDWLDRETTGKLGMPEPDELQALVKDTLLKFNEAVQIQYFAPFYQQISQAWQQQTSPKRLLEAFQVFIERDISFAGVANLEAEFTEKPVIDDNGILLVEGYFPHTPYRIFFDMKFIFEGGNWRLFGINLNLVDSAG